MKISAGRDYYDSAARFGIDTSITFVRNNREPLKLTDIPVVMPNPSIRLFKQNSTVAYEDWTPVFVVIADKIWRGICVAEPNQEIQYAPPKYVTHTYWTIESFNAGMKRLKLNCRQFKLFSWDRNVAFDENYFGEKAISKTLMDWMLGNGAAVITGKVESRQYVINVNRDDLKYFEFYKALDAYQAHQRIEQWVSGVLPRSTNPMIEISDKIKAEKHGFWKWSFKTPGKKGM